MKMMTGQLVQPPLDKNKAAEVSDAISLKDLVTLASKQPRVFKILVEGQENLE